MNSPLRILQLISSRGFYGAENMVLQLSVALRRLNCQIIIGTFQNQKHPNGDLARIAAHNGFPTELFPCNGRFDLETVRSIRKTLQRSQIHILHSHGYKANLYGHWAVRNSLARQVSTAHGWPGQSLTLRLSGILDRLMSRRLDHICAVSPSIEEQLKKYRTPREKISFIANGVDPAQFSQGRPVLKESPRFASKVVIGYIGRLSPEKGLPFLLEAAEKIVRIHPNVMFVLVGDGPMKAELDTRIRRLNLEANIVLTGQRSDLPDVYASLDVVVLPSLLEGMPMVIIEAMAAAKPVIATRVGGIPAMIDNNDSGILVTPGSVAELTAALAQTIERPEWAASLGRKGCDRVKTWFSSDTMARRYIDVYSQVCMSITVWNNSRAVQEL